MWAKSWQIDDHEYGIPLTVVSFQHILDHGRRCPWWSWLWLTRFHKSGITPGRHSRRLLRRCSNRQKTGHSLVPINWVSHIHTLRRLLHLGRLCYRNPRRKPNSLVLGTHLRTCVILITAMVNGFGSAMLWIAEGNHLSECANDSNKGCFNSLFWIFLMSSGIVGNLLGAFVVTEVKSSTFWWLMTLLCAASAFFFACVIPVDKVKRVKTE